ncbi:hypothetical protein AAG570_012624 [Ranatra chinensis]|uniref:Uncharacterized protein n=1 Tax=Ranatra chinensis TaxID=642074 RepID=A0ABD0YGC7_9HEMI
MSDARFARADNNTSPVQVTNMNQQSGNQAHQQPMINPTAMPHAYAYFYGGSVIPGSFQYGAPMYPVAAAGTGSGHGSTNSGVYNKGPTYTGGYSGTYEAGQGTGPDYKSGSQSKTQTPQTNNPPTSNDITMYSKSHAALSKSYDKQGFHCPTPPPFTLGSQNSGMGPAGGYTQQLFIPAMTPHHNTTLMHQPLHQVRKLGRAANIGLSENYKLWFYISQQLL